MAALRDLSHADLLVLLAEREQLVREVRDELLRRDQLGDAYRDPQQPLPLGE